MKALIFRDYGGPEAMEIAEMPAPEMGPEDIVVDVHAASVNPFDWKMREGYLRNFFNPPLPRILGRDYSGTVAAVGSAVDDLAPGDAVFGTGDIQRQGCHAEQLSVPAGHAALKPDALSHEEAAALGVSGLSAIAALETVGKLQRGETVLIHGGTGGVGVLAIQFAKSLGCTVFTTARAEARDFLEGLGAGHVIDYRHEAFEDVAAGCDLVLDTLGGEAHLRSYACLQPGGRLVYLNAAPIPEEKPRDDVEVLNAPVPGGRDALKRVAELAAAGTLKPVIDAVYPFEKAQEAYARNQAGPARGKILLRMR